MPDIDWSKVKLTANIARYWHPTPVEYIEDFAPEFAAQFAEHRGPDHRFALLHSGVINAATKWNCSTCGTGGDL